MLLGRGKKNIHKFILIILYLKKKIIFQNNNKSYLKEISICLHKESMEVVHCDTVEKNPFTNCKPDLDVIYI